MSFAETEIAPPADPAMAQAIPVTGRPPAHGDSRGRIEIDGGKSTGATVRLPVVVVPPAIRSRQSLRW